MTAPVKPQSSSEIMESVLLKGDLSKLTPQERTTYYIKTCESLGLNPLTQPFAYITLNSKLQLYALRACADQLRKINSVSLEIVSRDVADEVLTIHVRAKLPDGRVDEDLGAVPFPSTLKGEARANAELKAVTKAKRRATLSICGLGWLDETEVESIPGARKPPAAAPNAIELPHDPETGEITGGDGAGGRPIPPAAAAPEAPSSSAAQAAAGTASPRDPAAAMTIEEEARAAARRGYDAMNALFKRFPDGSQERARIKTIEGELWKLIREADAEQRS